MEVILDQSVGLRLASISQALTQASSSCTRGAAVSCSRFNKIEVVDSFLEFKQAFISPLVKIPVLKFPIAAQSSFQLYLSVKCSSSQWKSGVNEDHQRARRGCQICSVKPHSTDSPFTEKYSPKKSQGRGLNSIFLASAERDYVEEIVSNVASTFQAQSSRLENSPGFRESSEEDISNDLGKKSSQLPELRDVLKMLRERWEEEAKNGKRRGPGNVFLVGTGPGDPELLTVKALRLMQSADLVLYDRLVSIDILDLVHAGARLLYVGKTSGFHSRTQEEIHELLLNFAEAGATVVRLKGGDPLVFGRGGEEMDFLQQQGIQVKVIPGITAASGIAAELGIPLTHRGAANSVRFLTGHSRKGGDDPLYVAEQAADPDSTLVIYMGLATLPGLAAKLMANGLSPDTPAAAVERGTTIQQRTVFSSLATLPEEVSRAELVSPTLIFIGRVVALSPLWPSDQVSAGATQQDYLVNNSRLASPTFVPGKSERVGDTRDRRQRGPDPALPSQQ